MKTGPLTKALDALRRPGALLVLTHTREAVNGRAFYIIPRGGHVSDEVARKLLERPAGGAPAELAARRLAQATRGLRTSPPRRQGGPAHPANTRHGCGGKLENLKMGKLVKVNNEYVEQLRDEVAELGGNGFGTCSSSTGTRKSTWSARTRSPWVASSSRIATSTPAGG
jgi:hypothetical protein